MRLLILAHGESIPEHAMKAKGEAEVQLFSFLTWLLGEGEWTA